MSKMRIQVIFFCIFDFIFLLSHAKASSSKFVVVSSRYIKQTSFSSNLFSILVHVDLTHWPVSISVGRISIKYGEKCQYIQLILYYLIYVFLPRIKAIV